MLLTKLGKKIKNAQLSAQNTLLELSERMDTMEKGKSVDTTYSTKDLTVSLAASASTVNVEFGMPPNYFAGQTPPPGAVRPITAEPVRPVAQTGQTGAMVLASASTPAIVPIPILAATGRTNELAVFVPPYTTKSYG